MLATVVEAKALWETVIASLVATVGLTALFSLVILSGTRFVELRREDRRVAAAAAAATTFLGLAATLAGVAFGLVVMLSK